ncbi:MAG TPA: hypothetical protein VEX60_16010 [Pyrinomonadaceae bacterium]|nr:hypothetical protein [Pyrinomonadaceae bacterium]
MICARLCSIIGADACKHIRRRSLYSAGGGSYWDGVASIAIGVVLGIVAFVLARFSRGLLLGEAANADVRERIRQAMLKHPNVVEVVELLTMHLAPE